MASVRCVIHGWYDPSDDHPLGSVCVVEGCGFPAAFHLCPKHAFPGRVVEVENPGRQFVIGCWLVERDGKCYQMTLNDYTLGSLFGNRERFEKELASQGNTILRFATNEKDESFFRLAYQDIPSMPWMPDALRREGDGKREELRK